MKQAAGHSIAGDVRRSTGILTTALLIPAVLSLAFVLTTAYFFGSMTHRMEQEAALEPLVEVTIPESARPCAVKRTREPTAMPLSACSWARVGRL